MEQKHRISNQTCLVTIPNICFNGYGQDDYVDIEIQNIGNEPKVFAYLRTTCYNCTARLDAVFNLGSHILAKPTRVQTQICCHSCKKTQIKKLTYYVEDDDVMSPISIERNTESPAVSYEINTVPEGAQLGQTLSDFIMSTKEILNPEPGTGYSGVPGRARLNAFLELYQNNLPWIKVLYPSFSKDLEEIMSTYQYNWATHAILVDMGTEIQTKAKVYLEED